MYFLSKENRSPRVLGPQESWFLYSSGSSNFLCLLRSWILKGCGFSSVLGPLGSSRVLGPCFLVCLGKLVSECEDEILNTTEILLNDKNVTCAKSNGLIQTISLIFICLLLLVAICVIRNIDQISTHLFDKISTKTKTFIAISRL